MSSFEEEFPSMREDVYTSFEFSGEFCFTKDVQKRCLDKQRVREAFNFDEEWWEDLWQDDLDRNEIVNLVQDTVFERLGFYKDVLND